MTLKFVELQSWGNTETAAVFRFRIGALRSLRFARVICGARSVTQSQGRCLGFGVLPKVEQTWGDYWILLSWWWTVGLLPR